MRRPSLASRLCALAAGRRPARSRGLAPALAALLLVGCGEAETPLRVGAKDFTESLVLGELIAQVAEAQNLRVDRQIPYGGTFDNIEALKRGDLDVYPEYNGTGLVLLGQPPISDGDQAYARVQELYRPLGLVWGERLGFHNDYELVMRSDRAAELDIATISDLAKIEGEIRFGIDDEFRERPVDGYSAMMRRYGLRGTPALVTDDTAAGKTRLYEALLGGAVDVVEGFSTDGQIAEYGLVVLEDDLGFFPTYQPAPLLREAATQRFETLRPALDRLGGAITTEEMRAMNAAVELDGQDHRAVARRFLVEHGLIEGDADLLVAEELTIAVGGLDAPSGQTARAVSAVRKAFPGRSVTTLAAPDPMQPLLDGTARIALVSAEAFYEPGDGPFPRQREDAQALGVIGYDVAHLLIRSAGDIGALGDVERLGVGEAGSNSERTARMVLTSMGLSDRIELVGARESGEAAVDAQAEALLDGDLDALFLMAASGHPKLAELMGSGDFRLLSMAEWQDGNNLIRFPFLRLTRLPADTYPNMVAPVDTIGAQVVLAGPAAKADPIGTAGPGSAAIGEVLPLADKSILALDEHLASTEQLDPALPSAAILRPQPRPAPAAVNPSPARSVVNFVVICVIIYLLYLYFRKEPVRRRRPTGGAPAD